jgi:uroporphyrinogen-III synthase
VPPVKLPLANRRVLVTRTKSGASDLSDRLRLAGATVVIVPTIEIIPPDSYGPLDQALARLDQFDWVVFTSANAVEVFGSRRISDVLPKRVAVIGPATGRALERLGIPVTLQPSRFVAEALAEALAPQAAGRSVLLVRAAEARDVLPEALKDAGAEVTIAEAYRNRVPPDSIALIKENLSSPEDFPDVITFTSASTARNLIDLLQQAELDLPESTLLASIGPITSRAMNELGLTPAMEASEATIPALVQAICDYFSQSG